MPSDQVVKEATRRTPTKSDIATVVASAVIPVLALIWGMQPGNPYGYFTFLRIVVCFGAFVFAAIFVGQKRETLVAIFVGIAILFNPFFPVHLTRGTWLVIDATTIAVFAIGFGCWLAGLRRGANPGA